MVIVCRMVLEIWWVLIGDEVLEAPVIVDCTVSNSALRVWHN